MELLKDYDFDALSYIDTDYDNPQVARVVHSMIADEMRKFTPKNYTANFPYPELKFANSPALQGEWDRVVNNKSRVETIEISRYNVDRPDPSMEKDVPSWRSAVSNAKAQLEQQNCHLANLDTALKFENNEWLTQNSLLEKLNDQVDSEILVKKRKIDEINMKRRVMQEKAFVELNKCNQRRDASIMKQYQINATCQSILSKYPVEAAQKWKETLLTLEQEAELAAAKAKEDSMEVSEE